MQPVVKGKSKPATVLKGIVEHLPERLGKAMSSTIPPIFPTKEHPINNTIDDIFQYEVSYKSCKKYSNRQ